MSSALNVLAILQLFFFPGILLYQLTPKRFLAAERIVLTVFFSVTFWICAFKVLQTFHVSVPWLLFAFGTMFLLLVIQLRTRIAFAYQHGTMIFLAFVAFLSIALLPAATDRLVPAGADMSMHTYIAEHMLRSGTFPDSYEPLLPISHFGKYPIGFPSLITLMSAVNRLPAYQNANYLSAFTYILIALALYFFLRIAAHPVISAGVTILTLGMAPTFADVITWGGNPTVLSIALTVCGFVFILTSSNMLSVIPGSLILFAAYLTHPIPFAGFLYVAMPVWFYAFLRSRKKKLFLRNSGLGLIVFLFLWALLTPTALNLTHRIKTHAALFATEELAVESDRNNPITAAVRFVFQSVNPELLYLYEASAVLLVLFHTAVSVYSIIPFVVIIGLVINSYYLLLPLSYMLYPDRMVLVLLPFIAITIAAGITQGVVLLSRHTSRSRRSHAYALGIMLFFSALCYPAVMANYRTYTTSFRYSAATDSDIRGLLWLGSHTLSSDLICNNYGDAGLWIPAIAYRRPYVYHTNPIDTDAAASSDRKSCTYLFIGAKPIYPESVTFSQDLMVQHSEDVFEMFSAGGTHIYKIRKPGAI